MLFDFLNTTYLIYRAILSSRWTSQKLRKLQEFQLRKVLFHAYNNVPMYRELYNEERFRPDDFRSLDDLKNIPILSKARLKAASPKEVVVRGTDLIKCVVVKTSGSTGIPLSVYLAKADRRWQRAVAWRILFEHGFKWNFRTLEIRMTLGEQYFIQRLGFAHKDWISILEPPESWVKIFIANHHEVVMASASTLHKFAETVETLGLEVHQPRIVISDSETLSPATRNLIYRILGPDPVDVYGLVELSNFAWQCERREGYHISSDSHIVEVDADPGQTGPLIATGLGMWTMPIIRYDTGDLAEMEPEPCPCGRCLPRLRRICGRAVDSVVLSDGRKLLWPFFHEIFGGYKELHQWRIIQKDLNHIKIELIIPGDTVTILDKIKSDLCRVLPEDIKLSIERVNSIITKPGEKTRMVISEVKNI